VPNVHVVAGLDVWIDFIGGFEKYRQKCSLPTIRMRHGSILQQLAKEFANMLQASFVQLYGGSPRSSHR
jgi:hypothetical protein